MYNMRVLLRKKKCQYFADIIDNDKGIGHVASKQMTNLRSQRNFLSRNIQYNNIQAKKIFVIFLSHHLLTNCQHSIDMCRDNIFLSKIFFLRKFLEKSENFTKKALVNKKLLIKV